MNNRLKQIKEKGFKMTFSTDESSNILSEPLDFSKIKVGLKTLDDAVFSLGDLKKANSRLADKKHVLTSITNYNLEDMREISNFFMRTSGIYSRLVKYMSNLYRYDWMITPYINDNSGSVNAKVLKVFNEGLFYLDNFGVKRFFSEVSLKVFINGCYYGYVIDDNPKKAAIQELPVKYCRSRFKVGNRPAVEFNMKYFDDAFKDTAQKIKMLDLFPKEFKKGYILYKEGKLVPDYQGDTSGWYLLDTKKAFKFNMNGEDYPLFISVIPHLIDLDAAQELDRKKTLQQLLKIIIQKMPLDKNGDLVFDVDEAQQLHNNAVSMLSKAIGVDVLTTFADVDVADMADKNSVTSIDTLNKVERTVYNESGTAQNLFNTDGNIALQKSILNDEASISTLILQYEDFLNDLLAVRFAENKKFSLKAEILPTTIYNYQELSKAYKELIQYGYSKLLPLIALGQSQSSILNTLYFEAHVLDLASLLVPPMSSNTMSAGGGNDKEKADDKKKTETKTQEKESGGRKEKPDDEKSEKTIANRESMN